MKVTSFVLLVVGLYGLVVSQPVEKSDEGWWKNAIIYQIYPRSFKDSNNDGVGDLPGITSKLEHLQDVGVDAVWLSPIYKSPQVDGGYDITDFRDIHEEYGTLEDFDTMLTKARELGIRIIMDLVPGYTSIKHEWFIKSAKREPGYEDYYVWADGKNNNTEPPNNWISVFTGPSWTFHPGRGQWYLHTFASAQPDLNYRSPRVVQEMKDIMTFWLERGVSGFRLDAIPNLFEAEGLPDEPRSYNPNANPDERAYLDHIYTEDLPETFDMVYQWRELVDNFPGDEEKIIMSECYTPIPKIMDYYGNGTVQGAHFPFNFLFITAVNVYSSAADMAMNIQSWMTYMPLGATPNWVLGNHDQHRVASRYGKERADGLNLLHMLLPGVKIVYNGEEIAMEDGVVTYEEAQDPWCCNAGPDRCQWFSRDPERTPFQWDGTINAGFNEGAKTWLPVSEKYTENNLAQQSADGVDSSYHVFQRAVGLRKSRTLREGDLTVRAFNPRVIILKRELAGSETIVFAYNIGSETETVDLSILNRLPENLQIVITSSGSSDRIGSVEETSNVSLGPFEALVLSTENPIP